MDLTELERLLIDSLSDFKLDNDEKVLFKSLSESLSDDKLRFAKNKAFDLSRPFIETGGTEAVRTLNWLERVIKALQPETTTEPLQSSAYFSPGEDCRKNIIRLIKQARQSLKICVFTISDNNITDAVLDAHARGIKITVISDNDKANDAGSDIDLLFRHGITVLLDRSPYHMHHKFMLVDDRILLNGSFNWTRSASDSNEENITITTDPVMISLFVEKFTSMQQELGRT